MFWVHASSVARIQQEFTKIAAMIELPGRDEPKADIFRLLYNWLCDKLNGRWLLILDNADDDNVFASTTAKSDGVAHGTDVAAMTLANLFPQSANGWILVTSRDRLAAINLVGAANVADMEPMAEKEALALLKSRVSISQTHEADARTLVQALGYIPLAITHAAAYLAVRERLNVSSYLQLFRESEENQTHLLSSPGARDLRRDASVSHAIITTWQISFDQIRQTTPEAAELLSLMAMFDRQSIPESIVSDGRRTLQFEDAGSLLTRFSLIKLLYATQKDYQVKDPLFEMHDLVQLATRKWIEIQGQMDRWQKASLRIMADAFPSGRHETWEACGTLLPHAQKVLHYVLEENQPELNRATIAQNTSSYLLSMGKYAAAEKIGRMAVAVREKMLGQEHPDTLTSVRDLGTVLEWQGKYEEAESMQRQALEGREKVLGGEHPDTLVSVSQLGSVLSRQGKYEEAEGMHRRALEGYEKVLGGEHPDTLTSVSQLGSVLERQGKYEEAEGMHRRALEGYEKVLGREHPDTLASVSNLGSVLSRQGKYEEAEAMHRLDSSFGC